MPPNTNVVNSLPPLKKPEYLGGFIQPPAALHSYHQYPGYFPEPYIIEKKAEVSAGRLRLEPQKKKTGHTIKKTKPGFPKQPRTVVPPPDIEHVAPPAMPPPQKENHRNGKSKIHTLSNTYINVLFSSTYLKATNQQPHFPILEKLGSDYENISWDLTLLENPKNGQFGKFWKNWNLRSNSVTRQACFNMTFGGKCHNFIFFKWKNL